MLTIEQIKQAFGENIILDDVSFTTKDGEIIGLVAPNGTGKTTLLNIIMNFLRPDQGQVKLQYDDQMLDYSSKRNRVKMHKQITFLPELDDLYEELSGLEHLKFYAEMWKGSTKRVEEIVSSLHMEHYVKNRVNTYSLGMRQRLCFAMMLAADGKVMLMDEVMNGLDPDNVNLLTEQLINLRKQGHIILIASHLLDNLDLYADRVMFLKEGKIVFEEKESTTEEKKDLFIKIYIDPSTYQKIAMVKDFPEGSQYLSNKILCIPTDSLSANQIGQWVSYFYDYDLTQVTIGKIGTSEWYDEFYNTPSEKNETTVNE